MGKWCNSQSSSDKQYACHGVSDSCPATDARVSSACPSGTIPPLVIAFGIALPSVCCLGCFATCCWASRGGRRRHSRYQPVLYARATVYGQGGGVPAQPQPQPQRQQNVPGTATVHGGAYGAVPQQSPYGAPGVYAAPGPTAPVAEAVPPPAYPAPRSNNGYW